MLTLEEKATNHDTWQHIHTVQKYMFRFIELLTIKIDNYNPNDLIWSIDLSKIDLIDMVFTLIYYPNKFHDDKNSKQLMSILSNTIKKLSTNNNFSPYSYIILDLINRAHIHDQSKLSSPEVELFTEYTDCLAGTTYGSQQYYETLEKIKPALDHHYANNRHHPQFHKNGIDDMNLCDIIEMFCDWKAASERHNDGNIRKSIEQNADRFNMSPQLVKILENTVEVLF